MILQDLVEAVAKKSDLNKQAINQTIKAAFREIEKALNSGDEVKIIEFGVFSIQETRSRTGRNPKTGDLVEIPATSKIVFKADKDFGDEEDEE